MLNKDELAEACRLLMVMRPHAYRMLDDGLHGLGSIEATENPAIRQNLMTKDAFTEDFIVQEFREMAQKIYDDMVAIQKLLADINGLRRNCDECGQPFPIRRKNQRFCSNNNRCKNRWHQRQWRKTKGANDEGNEV